MTLHRHPLPVNIFCRSHDRKGHVIVACLVLTNFTLEEDSEEDEFLMGGVSLME